MKKVSLVLIVLLILAGLGVFYFISRVPQPQQKGETGPFFKQVLGDTKKKETKSQETSVSTESALEGEVRSQQQEKPKEVSQKEEQAERDTEPLITKISKEEVVATARACSKNESVKMYDYLASRIGDSCVDNPIDPLEAAYLEVASFEGLYDPAEDSLVQLASPDEEVIKRSERRPYFNVLFGFKDTYDPETGFKQYNPSVRIEIDALDGRVARVYYGSPIVFDISGEKLPLDFGL